MSISVKSIVNSPSDTRSSVLQSRDERDPNRHDDGALLTLCGEVLSKMNRVDVDCDCVKPLGRYATLIVSLK